MPIYRHFRKEKFNLTDDTIKMLKAFKRIFKENAFIERKDGNWLEEEQWNNLLEGLEFIEKFENVKFE
jgi:hypothetical protein